MSATISGMACYSHGKSPRALNLLIKFRTSGHRGLDWARHSGVSSVSHDDCHTHIRPRPLRVDRVTQQKGRERQDSDPLVDGGNCLFTSISCILRQRGCVLQQEF